jgi:glycosyltransferase involved in cell wall biosynthesis
MSDLPAWGSGAPGGATAAVPGERPWPDVPRRVALAHDYLLVMRGAERVFAAISDMFAEAPILTLLYDREALGWRFPGRSITTSVLQRLGADQQSFRRMLPLYPAAVGRLPVPPCEALISSSSAFAHGARAPAGAVHLCYCHSPFRYVWHERERALAETPGALRIPMRGVLAGIRRWDLAASRRVDHYVANSLLTRERIRSFYGREAPVVHPPVETTRFTPGVPGDELLLVSEIVAHKRVAVALEAARRARAPIAVAGSGPDHDALAGAYPEARFLGRVGDEELAALYASARAVVVPAMEEFGITAVEAQAAGRPVIAARAGGALETVLDGRTGLLAGLDDVEDFRRAIEHLERLPFEPGEAVANAERFSVAAFRRALRAELEKALERGPRAPARRGRARDGD